jgi:acyl-coenzyme A synthetase/AMP-(fatty) acid ligase
MMRPKCPVPSWFDRCPNSTLPKTCCATGTTVPPWFSGEKTGFGGIYTYAQLYDEVSPGGPALKEPPG